MRLEPTRAEKLASSHDPETHLIPLALAASANGRELQVFGSDYATPDGTCVRDYVHVNDLADAHVRALQYLERSRDEDDHSLAVNLGTGLGYSVLEVIRAAECATGQAVRLVMGPRRLGDPPILVADLARAHGVLGWTATRGLSDMVSSAWKWMRKNQARLAA